MMTKQFQAARRVSVPLIAIETPDAAATIRNVLSALNGEKENTPVLSWDIVRGIVGINKKGTAEIERIIPDGGQRPAQTINPVEALGLAEKFEKDTVFFLHNAHRFIESEAVAQAVWNLRDAYKENFRTIVLLAPAFKLPVELERDVVVLEESLPDDQELGAIIDDLHKDAGLMALAGDRREKAVLASRGLAAFPAEQAVAMALTKEGVDVKELWERKRKMIEQTRGLAVVRSAERFEAIGGNENAKTFGKAIFTGARPPSCVVFVDEIEKALGGIGAVGDSSGVSQDALGVLLRAMEDNGWTGQINVGPPGSGKSMYSKALGATYDVPTLSVDLGAAKGSLVGQSEQQIRAMVNVIKAVAGQDAYWVATCNKLDTLPPELRRRFRYGIWYFDLPDREEQATIWKLQIKAFDLKAQDLPEHDGWTGADIRNCCEIAWRLKATLKTAAQFITPVCKSDPESIERLRKAAEGRFLSASRAGVYRQNTQNEPSSTGRRSVAL